MNVKEDLEKLSLFKEQKIRFREAKLLFLSSLEFFPEKFNLKDWH